MVCVRAFVCVCFFFFKPRTLPCSKAAYLSHHAVIVVMDGGGSETPLGHQCSIHRPLALAIGQHGCPYTSSNMVAPCLGVCVCMGFCLVHNI